MNTLCSPNHHQGIGYYLRKFLLAPSQPISTPNLEATDVVMFFPHRLALLALGLHVKGNLEYVFFCVGHLSRSILFLRFVVSVACSFSLPRSFPLRECISLFIHSLARRHRGRLQGLTIMTEAAKHILMPVFL